MAPLAWHQRGCAHGMRLAPKSCAVKAHMHDSFTDKYYTDLTRVGSDDSVINLIRAKYDYGRLPSRQKGWASGSGIGSRVGPVIMPHLAFLRRVMPKYNITSVVDGAQPPPGATARARRQPATWQTCPAPAVRSAVRRCQLAVPRVGARQRGSLRWPRHRA